MLFTSALSYVNAVANEDMDLHIVWIVDLVQFVNNTL